MSRKLKDYSKKSNGKNNKQWRKKESVSPLTGQKHKSIAEFHGIAPMVIQTPEVEEPLTPRSSLIELQNQSKEKATLSEWLSIMKKTQDKMDSIAEGNNYSRQSLSDFDDVVTLNNNVEEPAIKIDLDDVKDESGYWNSSVVCYVLGANPPSCDGWVFEKNLGLKRD